LRFLLTKSGSANDGGGNKFDLAGADQPRRDQGGKSQVLVQPEGRTSRPRSPTGLTNATVVEVAVSIPTDVRVGPSGAGFGWTSP